MRAGVLPDATPEDPAPEDPAPEGPALPAVAGEPVVTG